MSAPSPAGGAARLTHAPALGPEIIVSEEYKHVNAVDINQMLEMQDTLENFKAADHKDKDPTSGYHFTAPGVDMFNACMKYQFANIPKHNLMITQAVLEQIPSLIKLLESSAFKDMMRELPDIITALQLHEDLKTGPEQLTKILLEHSSAIRKVSRDDMRHTMRYLKAGFRELDSLHKKNANRPLPKVLLGTEENPYLLGTTLKHTVLSDTRKKLKEALVKNKKKTDAPAPAPAKKRRTISRVGEAGAAGGAGEAGAAGAAGGASGDEDIEDSSEIDLNPCAGTVIGASLKNHGVRT